MYPLRLRLSRPFLPVLLLSPTLVMTLAVARPAFAKQQVSAMAAPAPLLPASFAGWRLNGAIERKADPGAVDATNAQVLKECGFSDYAAASYMGNGNTLSVHAMRFADATGAYSAYTFYRLPGTHPEEIGRGGAANGSQVIFWNGATVVDAKFDHLTAMSAAGLRELATKLPVPNGTANIPPSLTGYLPRKDLDITYTRYALGPEAYTRTSGVLPPGLIDFSKSPEVLSGKYNPMRGSGTLTLIEYPTPQLAAERERAIAAFFKAGHQSGTPWPQTLADSRIEALLTRRSGPLVAVTSGDFFADDAHALIESINYEASVTWNHPQGYVGDSAKAARLFLGVFALFAILGGTAVLLGVFFGGARVVIRRLRGKPDSTLEENQFIKLNLK